MLQTMITKWMSEYTYIEDTIRKSKFKNNEQMQMDFMQILIEVANQLDKEEQHHT